MDIDFCNAERRESLRALMSTGDDVSLVPLYTYLCPVIIVVCFFSIIFNAVLMSISRQSKFVNKSPILLLSLNLAVTDLIASLLNGISILFNSYLPVVHNFKLNKCIMLMFELIRCTSLVASALHLLALASVHYRGIVNPLHYRSTIFFSHHLSRTINIITIGCWLVPLSIMIAGFSLTPCQGFANLQCDYLFLLGFTFRYMVLTMFALPLLLMSIIYLRIFIIISRHQKQRRINHAHDGASQGAELSQTTALAAAVNFDQKQSPANTVTSASLYAREPAARLLTSAGASRSSTGRKLEYQTSTPSNLTQLSYNYEPQRRHFHASALPQTNTKALVTTLLILGTYFISYVPAIIYQVLTCIDYCPYPIYNIPYSRRVLFGAPTTLLLIAKSIIDPFIYSYRMNEIQLAINRYLSKRRSKTSSLAASMHTSQRFTWAVGAGGAALSGLSVNDGAGGAAAVGQPTQCVVIEGDKLINTKNTNSSSSSSSGAGRVTSVSSSNKNDDDNICGAANKQAANKRTTVRGEAHGGGSGQELPAKEGPADGAKKEAKLLCMTSSEEIGTELTNGSAISDDREGSQQSVVVVAAAATTTTANASRHKTNQTQATLNPTQHQHHHQQHYSVTLLEGVGPQRPMSV